MRQPVPFGKYLLLDRISVGGMAEVFRAKSFGVEGFEKLLAIKRILPSMADDSEFLRMFVDEAKIAGQLSHPSIGQIYELGREGTSPYIAMEYVWGKDLLQIYNRFGKLGERMPTTMACHIAAKACEGLDYAHRKRDPLGQPLRIVHRDCSPQNILVSYEGEVKIIDFGIAKAASRVSQTNAGVLKGKFAYLSPEQVVGGSVDRRSDLFALGTVFFECLTGERLFHTESDFSTLERVRDARVTPPREVCPDIPEEVEAIVMRALAKDPDERYQHGSEMLRDLQRFLRAQEHPYTSSALGAWLRRAFPDEMEREREQLERYRLVGPGGEKRASGPVLTSGGDAEVILSTRPSAPDHARVVAAEGAMSAGADPSAREAASSEVLPSTEGEHDDAEPTLLGGPSLADLEPDARLPGRSSPPGGGAAGDFADDGPTEVHGEIGGDPEPEGDAAARGLGGSGARGAAADAGPGPPAAASANVSAVPVEADAIEDLSDEIVSEGGAEGGGDIAQASTVIRRMREAPRAESAARQRAQSAPPPIPGERAPSRQTLAMPSALADTRGAGAEPGAAEPPSEKEHTAAVRLSTSQAATGAGLGARSTLLRDILIGVAVAVGALGLVFAGYAIFGPGGEPEAAEGTLEIEIPDIAGGTVRVDGAEVGDAADDRLTVEALAPGERVVEIVRDDRIICRRDVEISAGARTSVVCVPRAAPPAALILEGATDAHQVRIDGSEVDSDPSSEAIELVGGERQEIEVLRDGEVVDEFAIAPEPGDLVRRETPDPDDDESADELEAEVEPGGAPTAGGSDRAPRASGGGQTGGGRDRGGRSTADDSAETRVAAEPEVEQEPEKGYLVAQTQPWARVYIDGEDTGTMTPIAPRSRLELEPGVRAITFVVGDESFTYRVRISAGETRRIRKALPVDD